VKAFTAAIAALAATIQDRRKEAKVLLEAFEELC
jgi:hypothetical protein